MKSLFRNPSSAIVLISGHPVLIGSRGLQFLVRSLSLLPQLSTDIHLLVWIYGGVLPGERSVSIKAPEVMTLNNDADTEQPRNLQW